MPTNLSIASVIDKNKIASTNVWLVLAKIEVRDDLGEVVETMYLAKNNENVIYRGNTYIAAEFNVDFTKEANTEPSMKFSAEDITGAIRAQMEQYNGGVGSTVTITVVNQDALEGDPEIEETFDVTAASAPDVNVEWTLGGENPLRYPYPYREQYRDRCGWTFKSPRCGYVGAATTCDYTLNGANGCRVKGNIMRFGGFPSLRNAG